MHQKTYTPLKRNSVKYHTHFVFSREFFVNFCYENNIIYLNGGFRCHNNILFDRIWIDIV